MQEVLTLNISDMIQFIIFIASLVASYFRLSNKINILTQQLQESNEKLKLIIGYEVKLLSEEKKK